MTVLITGASGFVGRHVVSELQRRSIQARAAVRTDGTTTLPVAGAELVGLSGPGFAATDWANAVSGCRAVIHLAARAHVVRDAHEDPAAAFRLANVDFACACAAAAASAGVERFIFMSSVGVHGGQSGTRPFHAGSDLAPHTPYARSKADAERALAEVVRGSGTALTVIRPPLVYGSGAPGNFGAVMRAVERGWPLPLGAVTGNRRSFVAIDNLVDLIVTCLDHPGAANQAFLVSDGEDLSTADLLHRLGSAMEGPARLLPVPVGAIALGAKLLGKPEIFQSLCGSLQVDMNKTRELLGWCPPIGVDEGLKRAVGGQRC
jgi:nucleoside-diphosphate-sugar epimerase